MLLYSIYVNIPQTECEYLETNLSLEIKPVKRAEGNSLAKISMQEIE